MSKTVFSKEIYALDMQESLKDVPEWAQVCDGYPVDRANCANSILTGRAPGELYSGCISLPNWEIELAEDYGPEYVWPDGFLRIFSYRKYLKNGGCSGAQSWGAKSDGHAVINGRIVGTTFVCTTADNVWEGCVKIPCRKVETPVTPSYPRVYLPDLR